MFVFASSCPVSFCFCLSRIQYYQRVLNTFRRWKQSISTTNCKEINAILWGFWFLGPKAVNQSKNILCRILKIYPNWKWKKREKRLQSKNVLELDHLWPQGFMSVDGQWKDLTDMYGTSVIKSVISHVAHQSFKKPMILIFMVWTLEKSIYWNLVPEASYIYG